MKKLLILLLITILAIGLLACTSESEDPVTSDESEGDLLLTIEELAEYDGKDGSPAYIAVDGVIYDVSNSDFWEEGQHNGFEAGQDLTDEILSESPHGDSVLDRLTVVGTLED